MTRRVLVLGDGETWEELPQDSRVLVVEVSEAELARLAEGVPVRHALDGRTGVRVAWLAGRARRGAARG